MLKTILKLLDLFLPTEYSNDVEIPLLYRARIIVATNLVSLCTAVILLLTAVILNFAFYSQISILICTLIFIGHLYFLKKQLRNNESNLLIGTSLQLAAITGLIYLTAFSEKGMGFFGLIWLIPIFLMIAFYFKTAFSVYFALTNFILFLVVSLYKYGSYFDPLRTRPNFAAVFYIYLSLVIFFSYLLSFLFVKLSEELQREVVKQRDLLLESAKFQSLGRMASNLAHDINNPLFTIQGKLHQMRNLLSRDQLDLNKCDEIVENVEKTIGKLSQIVKGISTFAREGQLDQMVSVSVAELIESNLALATDRFRNSGIKQDIQIDPKITLICYPSFISQVILNLVSNAIDAMDALEVVPIKTIGVRAFIEKEWIYIIISDNGGGVPKEVESKIFEQFFTTKTFGRGTGLGLSISKGLVEVHGGELSYERQAGKTNFIVKLPSYE
jgi:signal transduction histidine kinase